MSRSHYLFVCVLFVAAFIATSVSDAQQQKKIVRIGFLLSGSTASDATRTEAFRQGLGELGYLDGQNITIIYRYAKGERRLLSSLAAELASARVEIIVAGGSAAVTAAKKATGTIPIVMAQSSDPVAAGVVASLVKPGGNVTGLSGMAPELSGKQLELLKEIVPKLSRVIVVADPEGQTYNARIKEIESAAKAMNVQLQPVGLRGNKDLENLAAEITKTHPSGLIAFQNPAVELDRRQIAELATKHRLPTVYIASEFADAGGLVSYGPHYPDLYRRAAVYVDKILKGAKPADLPVEQPTKFELVINLKTAKQIGLTIPPNVLARADRVIK
jgi:putative ABC transport system substrate-binding protein